MFHTYPNGQNQVTEVFFSYAHEDEALRDELAKHLKLLERQGVITAWHDRQITAGTEWEGQIDEHLETAKVILLLVSADFLASDYCYDVELKRAMERHEAKEARVIPVILREVNWKGASFGKLLALPKNAEPVTNWPNRDQAFADITRGIRTAVEKLTGKGEDREPAKNWDSYGWIFDVNGFRIPYIPLLNDWRDQKIDLSYKNIIFNVCSDASHSLSLEIPKTEIPEDVEQSERCAIDFYGLTPDGKLQLNFVKTTYHDYYLANEHLDDPIVKGDSTTFREKFGQLITDDYGALHPFKLSNICGVGLFLITKDNQLVVRKQSYKNRIYPGRYTFFSSGTIQWGVHPDPYLEVIRKAYIEMGHQVNLEKLEMVLFGVDARKLFFQFSFLERTEAKLEEIKQFLPGDIVIQTFFINCKSIIDRIFNFTWEPAAIATILTIVSRQFGAENVAKNIHTNTKKWVKHEMKDEWDYRGNRDGDFSVMSVRYPRDDLENRSKDYVDSVFKFIGSNVNGKHVLEIGSGNGRITEKLLNIAKKITCIECSNLMLKKAKDRLGDLLRNPIPVNLLEGFAQDILPLEDIDVIICSLVLIHNVDDAFYKNLVEKMCHTAKQIYVFEDTTQGRKTSPHTKLRPKETIIADFRNLGFYCIEEDRYDLYGDNISFFNFMCDK